MPSTEEERRKNKFLNLLFYIVPSMFRFSMLKNYLKMDLWVMASYVVFILPIIGLITFSAPRHYNYTSTSLIKLEGPTDKEDADHKVLNQWAIDGGKFQERYGLGSFGYGRRNASKIDRSIQKPLINRYILFQKKSVQKTSH